MRKRHLRGSVALLAAVLVLVAAPFPAEAQGPSAPEQAAIDVFAGGVDFFPSVSHGGAILVASRGDVVVRQVFGADERPFMGLYDSAGGSLPDGVYTWQLELLPDAATALELRIAATRNGGTAPNPWRPQSGIITIRDGAFVSPDLAEPGATMGRIERAASGAAAWADSFVSRGRPSADSDAMGTSEAEVQAAAVRASSVAASALDGGFEAFNRGGGADSDEVAPEAPAIQATEASRAPTAQRSTEPGGKNGRPTDDE